MEIELLIWDDKVCRKECLSTNPKLTRKQDLRAQSHRVGGDRIEFPTLATCKFSYYFCLFSVLRLFKSYIYIHIYIHIYVCMYTHTHIHTHTHIYIHIHTYIYHIYIYTYIHIHTYTHTHTYIYVCVYVYVCVCLCVVYTHIYLLCTMFSHFLCLLLILFLAIFVLISIYFYINSDFLLFCGTALTILIRFFPFILPEALCSCVVLCRTSYLASPTVDSVFFPIVIIFCVILFVVWFWFLTICLPFLFLSLIFCYVFLNLWPEVGPDHLSFQHCIRNHRPPE